MFAEGHKIARSFTRPIVISQRMSNGQMSTGIGAYIVVNRDGWIVTAAHIVIGLRRLAESREQWLQQQSGEGGGNRAERRRRQRDQGGAASGALVTHFSPWFGQDQVTLKDVLVLPAADLAMGRLDPFEEEWIDRYPTFKDPATELEPGTSLCKLGYPFHSITPEWDENAEAFRLPEGSVPPPLFPLEGIYTRNLVADTPDKLPFPIKFLETSSPGLRGQSGGPTFDRHGTVWAVQSQTSHLPLGFQPKLKVENRVVEEHQFLNVGLGVHPETLIGALTQHGIEHEISAY